MAQSHQHSFNSESQKASSEHQKQKPTKGLSGFKYYCWLLWFAINVRRENSSQFSTIIFTKNKHILHIIVNSSN